MFYSRTLTIKKNIYLFKAVISTDIIIKHYIELIMFCHTISNIFVCQTIFFTRFLSSHGNNSIYKFDTIVSITKFLENCNKPDTLNPYSQYSTHLQNPFISSTHNTPTSSDDELHQPFRIYYPYKNLGLSVRNIRISLTAFNPLISYMRNIKPMIICDCCGMRNKFLEKCMAHGP